MKHKRQTLSKDDSDEKDGSTADIMEKSRGDKLDLDEDDKKGCHNCDISGIGDVGSTLSDLTDIGPIRGGVASNNNNTPGATNNNNTSGYSNGASSVGSTNSVSSTFEKLIADSEDSRSRGDSEITSPSLGTAKKLSADVRIKVEGGHKSPNPSAKHQQQVTISKKSPSSMKDLCSVNSNGVLMALPDSTVGTPLLTNQGSSTRSLTPSSTPGTPASVQLQGSPLNVQQPTHGTYLQQRPKSSPSSSTANHSVANQTNHHLMHAVAMTGSNSPRNSGGNSAQTHYPHGGGYQGSADYRSPSQSNSNNNNGSGRQLSAQQNQSGAYYQQRIVYGNDPGQQYVQTRSSNRPGHRGSTASRANYGGHHNNMPNYHHQQQQQQHNQYNNPTVYNGYPQSGSYHASYPHAR